LSHRKVMSRDDVANIEDTLFFDPPQTRQRVMRFVALILFSSVIASGGLISNSDAAIIGAMIIAPLMVPIMAIVVAAVFGDPQRAKLSAIVLISGIGIAILVGFLMGEFLPRGFDVTNTPAIMSRTSPGLLDLIIALASGGAGAYALSRQDVTDSLPGVAIAISLVPPLNTAGILLASHESELARGALLLFITNMAAIFLAGSITFLFMGLARGVGRSVNDMRPALVAIVLFTIVIAIPLGFNTGTVWGDVNNEHDITKAVDDWIGDNPNWELQQVTVDGNDVTILLSGTGDLPPSDAIVAKVFDIVGTNATVDVRIAEVRNVTLTEES
jgi:uncharacterized hydrophobic protein (TIGR00271 family)